MKNSLNDTIHELLVKCLLNEASPEEQQRAGEWMAEDPVNLRYAEELRQLWEESRTVSSRSSVNEDAAWGRFAAKLQEKKVAGVRKTATVRRFRLSAAAAVLLLATLIGYWFIRSGQPEEQLLISENKPMEKTLPDSSVINLNVRSSLRYSDSKSGNERKVALKGEAFFRVKKDKKPFRIYVNDAVVTVLGTSFYINGSGDKTEVSVETGLVQVVWKGDTVLLHPHEKIILGKQDTIPEKETAKGALYRYFVNGELVCENTPLSELVLVLQQAYGARIMLTDAALKKLTITTTFRDMGLDQILDIIVQTLNIKVEKKGNQYFIRL